MATAETARTEFAQPDDFVRFTAGGVRWQVAPACREMLFDQDGLRLSEWLAAGQARIIKTGPH